MNINKFIIKFPIINANGNIANKIIYAKSILLILLKLFILIINWLRGTDLNRRPSGYEPDELPDCSTPRYY